MHVSLNLISWLQYYLMTECKRASYVKRADRFDQTNAVIQSNMLEARDRFFFLFFFKYCVYR